MSKLVPFLKHLRRFFSTCLFKGEVFISNADTQSYFSYRLACKSKYHNFSKTHHLRFTRHIKLTQNQFLEKYVVIKSGI